MSSFRPTTRLLAVAVGAFAAIGAFWWAIAVPSSPAPYVPDLDESSIEAPSHGDTARPAWDLTPFDVALWTAPPPPSTPQPPPPTPRRLPPPRYQLVGVVSQPDADDTSAFAAVLYDPDADTLVMVRTGDAIGEHTVQSVNTDGVTLAGGNAEHRLELDQESLRWKPPAEVGG